MKRVVVAAAGFALLLPVVSGCAAFEEGSSDTDDGIQVAAGFYPLQYAAERVAGGNASVESLTAPGGDAHDLELTPRETAEVAEADLVVYEGGFQPAVDDAVETAATGEVLNVDDVVELRPASSGHDHDGEHDDGHDEDEEHDHGDTDPHFWLDPLLMADLGEAVADRLAGLDPEHADDYRDNADALRAELERLNTEYTEGLARCERSTVVVSHDAFNYLSRYGLHFEPIAGLSPDAEPTPADLAHLQEVIDEDGLTTVFYESLVSPAIAEQLARDTGAQVAVLDPIEGLTDRTADQDYVSLMEANLAALQKANGC